MLDEKISGLFFLQKKILIFRDLGSEIQMLKNFGQKPKYINLKNSGLPHGSYRMASTLFYKLCSLVRPPISYDALPSPFWKVRMVPLGNAWPCGLLKI